MNKKKIVGIIVGCCLPWLCTLAQTRVDTIRQHLFASEDGTTLVVAHRGDWRNAVSYTHLIDLASGNFNMRDPVIYRINHMSHHRQGDKWCIYPMYDFAHPIQDALEGITHSLCSLEFEAHRPLYNWVIEHCELPAHPRQIEFARLGIDHTVMSKRKLRALVEHCLLYTSHLPQVHEPKTVLATV